jgi:hypothetical protein
MEREQIIGVLLQPYVEAECIRHLAREIAIYTGKSKYGWLGAYEAQRLKSLDENRRLKHRVSDLNKYVRWGLYTR